MLEKFLANWKTTTAGFLTFLIATLTTLTAIQIPEALLTPGASRSWLYLTVIANALVALARVWIGLIQNDAKVVDGSAPKI